MAEKELQKEVIDYIKTKDCFYFAITPPDKKHMVYGVKHQLPDLYILKNGVSIFIELKYAAYKQAHADRQQKQAKVRSEIIENGGLAFLITSLDKLKEII